MSGLAKATLVAISADAHPHELGTPVPVQFNPTSMRLQMTNSIDSGKTRARQSEQYLGTSSTTLSLDLVFDTADEGATDAPVNVRSRTMQVARFVLPEGDESKQAPPRVRFHWGDFIFDGVMTSLSEDIDLFSLGGVPLRAKVTVSIKEQDPRFAALESGPGAATKGNAPPSGAPPSQPGTSGGGRAGSDRTGISIAGESAADFAVRMGLDPTAWRGLAAGLSSTVSLAGGLAIDFSSSLGSASRVGSTAGVASGAAASLEQSFGLQGSGKSEGFALAAAGGVRAAAESVQLAKTGDAAAQARADFAGIGAPASPPPPPTPGPPDQPRPALAATGLPSPAARAAAPPAPPPPLADPRATSFGFGVPLRPRVAGAAADRAGSWVVVKVREQPPSDPPVTRDPTAAPWLQLPALAPERAVADAASVPPGGPCPCGCGGRH